VERHKGCKKKNETTNGLSQLKDFVRENSNTTII
jgi:hypothetical protein